MRFPRGSSRFPLAALATALAAALAPSPPVAASGPAAPAPPPPDASRASDIPQGIQAEPPPFTPGVFPCTQCHERAGDPKRRELAFHDEIQAEFHHGAPTRWCLDCHDNAKRDFLHLTNGDLVPFTESYRLCGQCHGDKYRDWRVGVHGKRVGMWNGQKTYFLCVNCHNPHNPKFKALKPEPPPIPPARQDDPVPPPPSQIVTPAQEKKP